jgi:hypothetical protein
LQVQVLEQNQQAALPESIGQLTALQEGDAARMPNACGADSHEGEEPQLVEEHADTHKNAVVESSGLGDHHISNGAALSGGDLAAGPGTAETVVAGGRQEGDTQANAYGANSREGKERQEGTLPVNGETSEAAVPKQVSWADQRRRAGQLEGACVQKRGAWADQEDEEQAEDELQLGLLRGYFEAIFKERGDNIKVVYGHLPAEEASRVEEHQGRVEVQLNREHHTIKELAAVAAASS